MTSPQGTIHLHAIRLDQPASVRRFCTSLLSDEELKKAQRFAYPRLKTRWTAARAALRSILALHLGIPATEILLRENESGKPFVETAAGGAKVEFNLSHSDNLAVLAVSESMPVGIDVERVHDIRDWPAVASRFFSPSENAQLERIEPGMRQRCFFLCWTRKEALIKATGEGLRARLGSFDVSLMPGRPAAVIADRSDDKRYSGWQLRHLEIDSGFVGAVAARRSRDTEFHCHGTWEFRQEAD